MHVETRQTPACYGDVAGPRRQPVKRRAKPVACAVAGAGLDTDTKYVSSPPQTADRRGLKWKLRETLGRYPP